MAGSGSAPRLQLRRRPPTSACAPATRSSPRPCSPARRASCATRRRSAATCSSAPAAPTSTTRPPAATSAIPARAARRSAASTACHAILGASDACIATHPSDMAVAMAVLDAQIELLGADGTTRRVAIGDFHRLPGDTPHIETVLRPGEMITGVVLPPAAAGPAGLPQGARPGVLRVRAGVRRGDRRGGRRHDHGGAGRVRRRGAQALALARGGGRADGPSRHDGHLRAAAEAAMRAGRGPGPQRLQDRAGQAHAVPHAGPRGAGG